MAGVSCFERWVGLAGLTLVLLALPACRGKSIEYVGKAGKSLGAHSGVIGSTGDICRIPNGTVDCEASSEEDVIIRKSIDMLATYGAALEELSGKKSVGASEFAGGVVALDGSTQWVDLGAKGPDAIKAGAKILDRIIASGVQRRVVAREYPNLREPLQQMERTYVDIVKGQLLLLCQIEEQVANNLENLAVIDCDASPDPACASMHQLAMMEGNELRSSLQNRRRALYRAAGSLSVFFAAHAALGDLLASRKSDAAVLQQMKSAGGKAKTSVEAELAAAEAERNCPYKDPPPEPEQP